MIIAELLVNDERTGPPAAALMINMLVVDASAQHDESFDVSGRRGR